MTTKPYPLLAAALLVLSFQTAQADRWATLSGLGDQLTIAEGETALVIFVPNNSAKMIYQRSGGPAVSFDLDGTNRGSINGNRGQVTNKTPLPLVGPATVTLDNTTVVGFRVVPTEIKTTTPSNPSSAALGVGSIPSNAVVIPSETNGPVEVLLESSNDLVSWNSAEPGTYGAASTNRFFRVRALIP